MRFVGKARLPVRQPFRLDLTAAALRRLAANAVDVVGDDGTYYRALRDAEGTTLVAVRALAGDAVEVATTGARGERWLPLVDRMLGLQADLTAWRARTRSIAWLDRLAVAFEGVKPPRYASAWEACAHAVVFQQISIYAAAAIMQRCVRLLGEPVRAGGVACTPFPEPWRWLDASGDDLRAAGLSRNKVAHLRSVATAFAGGTLDDAQLEALPTEAAAQRLTAVRGLGPWSAAVVLLRGLGRLDVFPMRDSGVARTVALLAGGPVDLDELLERLGPVRGMLYYHLLLGRLQPPDPPPGLDGA